MKNINEISWGNKEAGQYYPSPTQVSKHMPKTLDSPIDEKPIMSEFPGERYDPPFDNKYNEIVARANGEPNDSIVGHLREMEHQLRGAGIEDIISVVADSEADREDDMKYSFHITFQGFTGYYSWTDQWIGFDAEGQDVYGVGLPNLMQLNPDSDKWD
jgi:hypothetical protein